MLADFLCFFILWYDQKNACLFFLNFLSVDMFQMLLRFMSDDEFEHVCNVLIQLGVMFKGQKSKKWQLKQLGVTWSLLTQINWIFGSHQGNSFAVLISFQIISGVNSVQFHLNTSCGIANVTLICKRIFVIESHCLPNQIVSGYSLRLYMDYV